MKRAFFLYLAAITVASGISFFAGRMTVPVEDTVHYIDYSDYLSLVDNQEDFVLYIGRSSCKVCAIVYGSIHEFAGHGIDVYALNLESLRGTETYTKIKEDLGFYYMPCFKAYKDGVEVAHLNNPLSDSYFEEGADYPVLLQEMEENVISFLDGVTGKGPFITEKPMTTTITATPVKKED